MNAIILAAGCGRRISKNIPKCLLEINNTTLLENCLNNLVRVGVEETHIVVGYEKEKIIAKIGDSYAGMPIKYTFSANYATTNNIVSLHEVLSNNDFGDVILVESDIYFGREVLPLLTKHLSAGVGLLKPHMSGTTIKANGLISEMILNGKEGFKTANIYFLTKEFIDIMKPFLRAWIETGYTQEYYEAVFADIIKKPNTPKMIPYVIKWEEIDDLQDLERAKYQLSDKKYEIVSNLHGNFWNYDVVDHCHLYNMYFPPEGMLDYFKSNIKNLTTSYPSAHSEIAYYLSQWLGIDAENLVIGNGASEIIRMLGTYCISTPSFNEFENVVTIPMEQDTWQFDKYRFVKTLNDSDVDYGVIITPNNPTSIAVDVEDIRWTLENTNKNIIIDESFIDFSDKPSCLSWIKDYENLFVLKSLGKAFGICGLRLGFLASCNPKIQQIRKKLPIWNINGFAEAFVRQIARYDRQFRESCQKTKEDRNEFYLELNEITQTWKPDANFLLCKVPKNTTEELFKYNLLVKSCENKAMNNGNQYIRIGCRTPNENFKLCECLKSILRK